MINEECAYYVDNWFYGYQVYCANPIEYWVNPSGWALIVILIGLWIFFYDWRKNERIRKETKGK